MIARDDCLMMGDPKTVLEGCLKYRDKKKWKARWAVVSKLSPVADCLHLQLYRDSKERCKNGPTKASLSLEGFLGMESGFTLDKESNTMALICSELVVVLAFDSRELLIQWQVKIRANLVEEQQFLVQIANVPTKSKLPCGPARLHLQDHTFCVVSGVPPRLLSTWPIKELRRFGVVEGRFCFEGGSLCGKGEGLHVLLTNQSEELAQAMDLASKGKLLGKRKTLSRKNSVLETSTRMSLHKSHRRDSGKCSTESSLPLLSSGSESSTCDACSEILRSTDVLGTDDAYSTKTGSRFHYRWPSCVSRWGQGSTTTTSDVESMDTVSVTLSDFQGSSHCSTISKTNGHGQSMSCLCDSQGTWPFNHCTKCGRQFYGRSTTLHQNGSHQRSMSPEIKTAECSTGFSPQWTMDLLVVSPSSDVALHSRKDTYQTAKPSSDRTSLCSHTSHSSSASTASSSGSEYSVPRNFLESLYDKPKNVHQSIKSSGTLKTNQQTAAERRLNISAHNNSLGPLIDKCVICPCHEPTNEWTPSVVPYPSLEGNLSEVHVAPSTTCSCWNTLAMTVKRDKDSHVASAESKASSANPTPSSSPMKVALNPSSKASRSNDTTAAIKHQIPPCMCKRDSSPYTHYAVPRTALANMYLREKQASGAQANSNMDYCRTMSSNTNAEDYDVPKKFADILTNGEGIQKAATSKVIDNGSHCSCSASKTIAPPVVQETETRILHHHQHHPSTSDAVQMCTCQRVMLWAGSLVPCLGGSLSSASENGWQFNKTACTHEDKNTSKIPHMSKESFSGAVCNEPPRIAEIVLVNGKTKYVVHKSGGKQNGDAKYLTTQPPDYSAIETPSVTRVNDGKKCNYANLEFSLDAQNSKALIEKSEIDSSSVNYANLDFVETLPLYENSTCLLSRVMQNERGKSSDSEKPPLPPRGISVANRAKLLKASMANDNTACCCKTQSCIHKNSSSRKVANDKENCNGTYEVMCFMKMDPNCHPNDEDYLLMKPLFPAKSETCLSKCEEEGEPRSLMSTSINCKDNRLNISNEEGSDLPLRPFMPFSYPSPEFREELLGMPFLGSSEEPVPSTSQLGSSGMAGELMSRKNQLISEDPQLRSTRSNSLSDLKKKVLMRKRSSSVDGKGNVSTEDTREADSNVSSSFTSPKLLVQRKNSFFAKLSLRSKEKSMSTNEIILPVNLPTVLSPALHNYHKSNLHRSADCLKLNEEYTLSDDDMTLNEHNDVIISGAMSKVHKAGCMKRSSSVPCRTVMPSNGASTNADEVPIFQAEPPCPMNDLNHPQKHLHSEDHSHSIQRKYSLDSHERPKSRLHVLNKVLKPNCDTNSSCKHNPLPEHCTTILESQVVLRNGNRAMTPTEKTNILDTCKSTTSSSSSSDMSDYIESLSFCSRSSSSSSGSCDFIRADELSCLQKGTKPSVALSPALKTPNPVHFMVSSSEQFHHCVHQYHPPALPGCTPESCNHPVTPTDMVKVVVSSRTKCDSRSPSSSTSSLSTSPSTTDYSSSTSSSSYLSGKSGLPDVMASSTGDLNTSSQKESNSVYSSRPAMKQHEQPACRKQTLPGSVILREGKSLFDTNIK